MTPTDTAPNCTQISLEIPAEWCVWRGYQLSGWRWSEKGYWYHYNSADTPSDASEAAAENQLHSSNGPPVGEYDTLGGFPYSKPDVDIFLAPPRTRKQRGWYQVVPYPPNDAAISGQLTQSTAATLPPELLHMIVEHFIPSYPFPEDSISQETAQEIRARCSLVCHHWARVLRPSLFSTLVVCTQRQCLRLIDLLSTPSTHIAEYARLVSFRPIAQSPPFLHLVSRVLCLLNLKWGVDADIWDPKPSSQAGIRSIHWQLPRALPRSASQGITRLSLQVIKFPYFAHLGRVLSELPFLGSFDGEQLTWPPVGQDLTASTPWLRHWMTSGESLNPCTLVACSQSWPFLWFGPLLRYTAQDAQCLCTFMKILEGGLADMVESRVTYLYETMSLTYTVHRGSSSNGDGSRKVRLSIWPLLGPGEGGGGATPVRRWQVAEVTVNWQLQSADLDRLDWRAISEALAPLRHLRSFDICLEGTDRETAVRDRDMLCTKLGRISKVLSVIVPGAQPALHTA